MQLPRKPPSIIADYLINQQITRFMRNPKSYNRVGTINKNLT